MPYANDTTRLLVASDISTFKFEIVDLIGSQSEPRQSSYTTNSVWSHIAHL
jgi:hypothetical protein